MGTAHIGSVETLAKALAIPRMNLLAKRYTRQLAAASRRWINSKSSFPNWLQIGMPCNGLRALPRVFPLSVTVPQRFDERRKLSAALLAVAL